ncbi:MAG: Nramp family divalent metal transporter, partial [Planctomycetaceae bacterium]
MSLRDHRDRTPSPRIPATFLEYVRSFGPGIVVVLTWLGAGDIVGAGVSGGNYGYALMWVLVLAALVRFVFVSLIAKYQLCNPQGESVLDGLVRLHSAYAPFLTIAAVVMVHVYGAYMLVGCGETWVKLTGFGATWQWSLVWLIAALALVFRPVYQRVETVFKVILAVLAASLVGAAVWAGPNPAGIVRGAFGFALPQTVGPFGAMRVAVSMIGALGGALMYLAYPYWLERKGWR